MRLANNLQQLIVKQAMSEDEADKLWKTLKAALGSEGAMRVSSSLNRNNFRTLPEVLKLFGEDF
jgi:hypothetical protein